MNGSQLGNRAGSCLSRVAGKKILAWAAGVLLMLSLLVVLVILISAKIICHVYEKAPDPLLSHQIETRVEAEMLSWVTAEVAKNETLSVRLSKLLEADIPLKQNVSVLIDNDFLVPLDMTFSIPIDQEILIETEVPIETHIPLDGIRVQTRLWGLKNISVPLYGSFPVKMTIPFKDPIHVKTEAEVRVQQEVLVHVKKTLTLPLDLKAHVFLPIDDIFTIRLPENISLKARVTEKFPVDVCLSLNLPKNAIPQANQPAKRETVK
jgi:hypothetical protein